VKAAQVLGVPWGNSTRSTISGFARIVEPYPPIEISSLKPAMEVARVSPRPAQPCETRGKVRKTNIATMKITPESTPLVARRPRPMGTSRTPWCSERRRTCPTMSATVASIT
jgi:hypothetical protein